MFTYTINVIVSVPNSEKFNKKIVITQSWSVSGGGAKDCSLVGVFWNGTKHLYTLNLNINSSEYSKATVTGYVSGQGNDRFLFVLNGSNYLEIGANAGSCWGCGSCGGYTNIYSNATATYDITPYLRSSNTIAVYMNNYTGDFSYSLNSTRFVVTVYSKDL